MEVIAESKPVRVGIVGIGRAGWGMHAPAIAARPDRFTIAAACDTIASRRERMVRQFGCAGYARIEDLLADPSVDLVDIATRSCDHFRHACLALRAGKHVMLEKPMAVSLGEAVEMERLASRSKGRLFIHHNRRFEPGFQHVREIIESGILGDIYVVLLRRLGFQRRDDWQTLKRYGGGQLLNWGPHVIDHALRFLNAPVVRQWSALQRLAALGDAEDYVKIVLAGENGRIVDLEISGAAALPEPEIRVRGSRGALECDGATIHMKYLDPAVPLEKRAANPRTPGDMTSGEDGVTSDAEVPGTMPWAPYVSPESLVWVTRSVQVAPAMPVDLTSIWDALFDDLAGRAAFPVTIGQSVDVMRIIEQARNDSAGKSPEFTGTLQ